MNGFLLTGLEPLSDGWSFLLETPADAMAEADSLEAALIAAGPEKLNKKISPFTEDTSFDISCTRKIK